MSTADWREEKSEFVVESLCRALTLPDLSEDVKRELEQALWDALKLYADALEERLCNKEGKWSPSLVNLFRTKPQQYKEWLSLMAEDGFDANAYWKQGGASIE